MDEPHAYQSYDSLILELKSRNPKDDKSSSDGSSAHNMTRMLDPEDNTSGKDDVPIKRECDIDEDDMSMAQLVPCALDNASISSDDISLPPPIFDTMNIHMVELQNHVMKLMMKITFF